MTANATATPASTLLVGFDSAWTRENRGGIVAVLMRDDGTLHELGLPQSVNFAQATDTIRAWQAGQRPDATIVLLDQPTIVNNATGQRPVEHLVSSPVSLRLGGMQPANRARVEMFGDDAPVWRFLDCFGGAADPLRPAPRAGVFETYPVLTIISLGWLLPDVRVSGRLPKYNPQRRSTFSRDDWRYLCTRVCEALAEHELPALAAWSEQASAIEAPRKHDQDALDACLCLLVALHLARGRDCLLVGDVASGYIVVPHGDALHAELDTRCRRTGREPARWLHRISTRPVQPLRAASDRAGVGSHHETDRQPPPRSPAMTFDPPIPLLRIFDEAKAKEFYVDFLGFAVDWEHRFEPSLPLYMQVSKERCVLHLSEHHGDASPGAALRVRTDALDALHAALTARQYRHARPGIVEQPWGRDMTVTDPFGNRITFCDTAGC